VPQRRLRQQQWFGRAASIHLPNQTHMCVEVCSHQIVCNPDTTLCCWSAHALDNLHKTSNRTACNMSDPKPQPGDTLVEAALKVLLQADPWLKAEYTYAVHRMWNNGEIATIAPSNPVAAPDRPSRDDSKVPQPPAACTAAAAADVAVCWYPLQQKEQLYQHLLRKSTPIPQPQQSHALHSQPHSSTWWVSTHTHQPGSCWCCCC
jgi:hypothetical protein